MSDYDSEGNFIGEIREEPKKKKRKVAKKKGGQESKVPAVPLDILEGGLNIQQQLAEDSPFSQLVRSARATEAEVAEVHLEEKLDSLQEAHRAEKEEQEAQQKINNDLKIQMRAAAAATLKQSQQQQETQEDAKTLNQWASGYSYKTKNNAAPTPTTASPKKPALKERKTAAERYAEWRDTDWTERLNPRSKEGASSDPKSFQYKEKRKRAKGMQSTGGINFIEDEKRILRQAGYGGGL
eukprot:TRINITY_DN21756_c0_g1_i1.p1 TRINITY_DN21756_c0_g1~~TRINITY_DN21756_c0_g1_i1.p1  ORF type:complete len:259 (+),score=90.16 TRINITY_DN21756_c0_g1_i1:63-779(+)